MTNNNANKYIWPYCLLIKMLLYILIQFSGIEYVPQEVLNKIIDKSDDVG